MIRADSIQAVGLEAHINAFCMKNTLPWRYKNFVTWVEEGDEVGEPVKAEWLRRRFGVSRPTMDKWLLIYKEQKSGRAHQAQ